MAQTLEGSWWIRLKEQVLAGVPPEEETVPLKGLLMGFCHGAHPLGSDGLGHWMAWPLRSTLPWL